ncbi:hypothetical protein [Streptomyces sp. NPDC048527]|uniref:hypothetical protein n=1 Tax=Streptomyces sp. NPDC048527 TaxID=3365568 RepID=UPI003723DD2A
MDTRRHHRLWARAALLTVPALDDFFARFEPPALDKNAIVYTGHVDAVYEALTAR